MDTLNQLRQGKLPWTSENTESLWACTSCRLCTSYCNHKNEPGLVLLAGRQEANAKGAGHPALSDYPERFHARDARLATKLAEYKTQKEGVVGFWPGCDALDKGTQDLEAALEVFAALGGEEVVLVQSEQVCGGYPLLAAGHPEMFRWHAERVAASLSRFETIITNCSACLFSMQSQYAAEGVTLRPRLVSVPQYLQEQLAALPKKETKETVYYHDPCHLARYSGVIEEPRQVLSRIADVRDFAWSHEETECCGGAGLLPKTDPDTADAMARRRMREVAQRGGGTIVSACATCTYMLRSNAPSGVKVRDLAAFVADALEV